MIRRFFSQKMKFDLAIVGAGPGGYVAAIKAGQLGLKTALIEKHSNYGGCCLNVGCIPSKTLLNISHKYHDLFDMKTFGLKVENPSYDWPEIQKIKQNVIQGLSGGIGFLLKKNGVTSIRGTARITDKNNIEVAKEGETETINTSNILIATGSEPISLPGFEMDEK